MLNKWTQLPKGDWHVHNYVDFVETYSHKRFQQLSIRKRQVNERSVPWPFCPPWFFWWLWCPESLVGWWFPGTRSNPQQPSASFYTPWYMYHVAVNRWIIYIQWYWGKKFHKWLTNNRYEWFYLYFNDILSNLKTGQYFHVFINNSANNSFLALLKLEV